MQLIYFISKWRNDDITWKIINIYAVRAYTDNYYVICVNKMDAFLAEHRNGSGLTTASNPWPRFPAQYFTIYRRYPWVFMLANISFSALNIILKSAVES